MKTNEKWLLIWFDDVSESTIEILGIFDDLGQAQDAADPIIYKWADENELLPYYKTGDPDHNPDDTTLYWESWTGNGVHTKDETHYYPYAPAQHFEAFSLRWQIHRIVLPE